MNQRVLRIYKEVMSVPEGLTGKEYKRLTHKYVGEMSTSEIDAVCSRADEIEERSWDEWRLRKTVFLELGFMDTEAGFFAKCRMDSPGIRTLLTERVEVTKHATDKEIKQINEGSRGTLRALNRLYGKGGEV